MSRTRPDYKDYRQLFRAYGNDLGSLYKEPEDDRYALLFEQVVRLLIKPSPFNLSLPEPFRVNAQHYLRRERAAVERFSDPVNRHFMLCDLYDLVELKARLARKRREQQP